MSYGLKYKFILQSANGAEVEIDVLQDGYSGTVTQRALGNAPVLRQQKSGGVLGSSLAFSPECLVDGEFAQFYTTDAKEFMVELYRNNVKIWSGFIVPELYSEPDIAPPYDVDITAADGLGELRRYDFPAVGKVTLQALFVTLLGYTGQTLDINFISGLNYSGCSAAAFFLNTYIDLDYMAGKTCYEVLNYLLDTFHAQICYYAGRWLISRENDVTFDANGKPVYINASGQTSAYDGGKMAVTSMDDGPIWPVDFTSSSVDPALRSIVVEAPWNLYSGLVNSGMASDTGWTKSSNVSFVTGGGYRMLPDAYITQSITQLMGKPFLLTFDAATYIYHRNNVQQYSTVQVEVTFVEGNNTWYLVEDDSGALVWSSTSKIVSYRIENAYGRTNAIENQLSIPVFEDSNGDPVSGTLSIKFVAALNQGLYIYGAWLTVADEKGWKDILNINNGARGEADTVQIAVGYETSGINSYKNYYGGILLTSSDALITSLSTGNFSNMDFLALISRDYARSIALPRLRTDGVINTPAGLSEHPLILAYRGTNRWIETFDWDLLEDNLNFSALSLPSASLSVDSEVITATGSASGSADKTIGRLGPGGGEGQDGLTIMLSNYARVFAADANGYAYYKADTVYVKAFRGDTAKATTIGTIVGTVTGLSATKMNNGGTNAAVVVTAQTTLNQSGSLIIPVTADGVTVNLNYSWSLSPKGEEGDPGTDGYNTATVTLYQRAASSPSKPSGSLTYTFSTGALSGTLGNWSLDIPATDGNPLWVITALAVSRTATATIASSAWNGPVKYAEDGTDGKTPRGPSVWSPDSIAYQGVVGSGNFIDFCIDENDPDTIYYCKQDHTSDSTKGLSNSTYWQATNLQDFVATKVLFANYAFVKNLAANAINVSNAGGTVFGGMMPPSTDGNGDYIFWAGGSTPSNAPFTVDKNGQIKATSGVFGGFLQMPFVELTSGATYVSTRKYQLADKCNLSFEADGTDDYTLVLPTDAGQNGKVVNIFDFPIKGRLSSASLKIQTDSGCLFIPGVTNGDWGLYPQTYITTGRGGYIQLTAIKVGNGCYWMVTVNGATNYSYGY